MAYIMTRLRHCCLSIGAACIAYGCVVSNPQPSSDAKGFILTYRQAYCEVLNGCCATERRANNTDTCERLGFPTRGISDAVAAGVIVFDERAGNACLDELSTLLRCPLQTRFPPGCDTVLVGTRALGEECESYYECAPSVLGAVGCVIAFGEAKFICSVKASSGEDEPCAFEEGGVRYTCREDEGMYCDPSTDTCRSLVGGGDSCSQSYACAPGLTCDDSKQLCVEAPAIGENCLADCALGAYCGSATCRPKKDVGEDCYQDYECGGVCNDGTCEPLGTSACWN